MRRPASPTAPDRIFGAGSFTLLSIPPSSSSWSWCSSCRIKLGVPHTGPSAYVSLGTDWIANLESLSLPSFTLAIGSFVVYYRVLRSDLIATLAGGVHHHGALQGTQSARIMWRHAFRPSSVALLGTARVNIGGLLAAGFIVQYLLSDPGLGYTLIQSIGFSDFLVVQGIVLVVSVGWWPDQLRLRPSY
jgi:peptide/nickel transport system permease protein